MFKQFATESERGCTRAESTSDYQKIFFASHRFCAQRINFPHAVAQNNEKSTLQHLLDIVVEAPNLMRSNPWVLYECVRGIHSLWFHRIERPTPVTSLTIESKFWKSLIQVLHELPNGGTDKFNLGTAGYILQVLQTFVRTLNWMCGIYKYCKLKNKNMGILAVLINEYCPLSDSCDGKQRWVEWLLSIRK